MECAVCYSETGPFQKLCCGHTFCKNCVKEWYLKGVAGTSCPMCRKPMYFKGFHKTRDDWNSQAYETRCAEVFSEALDDAFGEMQEFAEQFPEHCRPRLLEEVVDYFIDIEKTYRFLKHHGTDPSDMEDVFYWGDYYSDRHLDTGQWLDEPPRDPPPRYPVTPGSARPAHKRCRARQDPWWTLSFYVEV